ncbi:glutathione S-transferase family protein [Parasphingorhabdus cellanae]|uniref:Glutathione S-transferase n=1 Tax=Parasphingorhabdus cellanae TaxID=2806553 RepID=A0ABX7T766_9SPHN|nr:glutathione S-transferase family protein [Parasphingorhabdus cellanae]QTD57441.1 glutathione S-transferase [Parasphingorhabdus cellanae]
MKLFYSPFHSFIHKVLVTAHECGHWDDIDFVPTFPFKNLDGEDQGDAYSIVALNPLGKVPTLATDTGQVIYGSQAICEYFDVNSKARKMYPAPGPARWDAITRLALGDTIFETTVQMVAEQWQEPEQWNMRVFESLWPKYIRALDGLEQQAGSWTDFDIGHASLLHAISYLGFRAEFYEAKDPIHPDFRWRDGRPALSDWFDAAIERPSVQSHYNKDFEGDTGAKRCQQAVQDILALQKEHAR